MKNKATQLIIKFLAAALISTAIYLLIPFQPDIYIFFFTSVWLVILLRYGNRKNKNFLINMLDVSAGCTAAYILFQYFTDHISFFQTAKILFPIGTAALLVILIILPWKKESDNISSPKILYKERDYDLQRILDYILEFEILGVNAVWGAGKTFVANQLKLKPEVQDQFEIIQIDLLSCNLDMVELILVEELEKVFQRNHIYPQNSHQLKRLLGKNEWTNMLVKIIDEDTAGLSASYESLCREFDKLNKKILVIFEDIDRIYDKTTIQKLFAISEKISGKRLHIIFHYDIHVLKEKGFDRDYLEKYIPYTVNLTVIPYEKLVEYLWKDLGMPDTPLKMDYVRGICHNFSGLYKMNHLLGADINLNINLPDCISVRKVRIFLSELKKLLTSDNITNSTGKEDAKTVLHIVFIKHFFNPYYEQLRVGESPLQSLRLVSYGKEYTLPEVLAKYRKPKKETEEERNKRIQDFRTLIHDAENCSVCGILFLLDYELEIQQIEKNTDKIATEPLQNLKNKYKNEKIDRIVWNILANGTSELTDIENAVQKLQQEVLNKEKAEQENAWEKYTADMFNQNLWKDNKTIFLLGTDPFLSLFKAMRTVRAGENQWTAFLSFYFSQYLKKHKTISVELVDNFNYCNLHYKNVYFQVIHFINGLETAGNMNNEKSYWDFFENYMGAAAILGYLSHMESWMFKFPDTTENNCDFAKSLLKNAEKELEQKKEKQKLDYVTEDFSEIIRFTEKNLELIQCKESTSRKEMTFKITESKSSWIHQNEVDRLKELKEKHADNFLNQLEKSYREGKIYLPERGCKKSCVYEL